MSRYWRDIYREEIQLAFSVAKKQQGLECTGKDKREFSGMGSFRTALWGNFSLFSWPLYPI
jgi:hypothetical protein